MSSNRKLYEYKIPNAVNVPPAPYIDEATLCLPSQVHGWQEPFRARKAGKAWLLTVTSLAHNLDPIVLMCFAYMGLNV